MPRVAVLYYSQTGQSQRIADSLYSSYKEKGEDVVLIPIQPRIPYAFPWKMNRFFEQMPLCIEGHSAEIEPLNTSNYQDVERVVLIHPVWFLSPSLPVQEFFKLPEIEYLLRSKKFVQILTCRNMWFSAAKITRQLAISAGANYCGQIAIEDPHPNWASLVTTPRWMFSGKKEAFAIFPSAGIPDETFKQLDHSLTQKIETLFEKNIPGENFNLNRSKSLSLCLEVFGRRFIFKPWAKIILKSPKALRSVLLLLFRINLVLFLLAAIPVTEILSRLVRFPFQSFAKKQQLSLGGSL